MRGKSVSRTSSPIAAPSPPAWIAFEYAEDDRWYFGRVESRQAASPAGVTLRLEGMGVELNEAFPGGFNPTADGVPPHRYANTDLFFNDPDYLLETLDSVNEPQEVAALILQQYVVPNTHIAYDPANIEAAEEPGEITSLKFRGEETARSILKELALRNRNASWGVDETGTFFFLKPRTGLLATWHEGRDLLSLEESADRDLLYNRVLLTGDYVYDAPVNSEITARGFYRWRGNYVQPASRDEHGERRIRLWVPWIRTRSDSREFVREFFRLYAQPAAKFTIEVAATTLPRPWLGRIRLEDRDGNELITAPVETIRVQFDHVPKLRLQLGPEDPRLLWPEPPHDERWELPWGSNHGGDSITLPPSSSSSSDSSEASSEDDSSNLSSEPESSDISSHASSNETSADSSDLSSDDSSLLSSDDLSDNSSASESNSEADSSAATSSDPLSSNTGSDGTDPDPDPSSSFEETSSDPLSEES